MKEKNVILKDCFESSLKPGDKVLYGKYSEYQIVHDGKELLIMRESDILAVALFKRRIS